MNIYFSRIFILIIVTTVLGCVEDQNVNKKDDLENKFGILIHGGAWTIFNKNI